MLLTIILLFGVLNSCTEDKIKPIDKTNKKYGGILKVNIAEGGELTFIPHKASRTRSVASMSLGYETLLKYDDNHQVIAGLAEKWELNSTKNEYTLYLRENVYFHDDECFDKGIGREFNSEDVAYCLSQLCIKSDDNAYRNLFYKVIKGGDSIKNNDSMTGVEIATGITIIDDYTLKIKLNEPNYSFLDLLTHYSTSIYPREAKSFYGKDFEHQLIGTGPFILKAYFPKKSAIFIRNNKYWQEDKEGNPLPYLDGVKITYESNEYKVATAANNNMVNVIILPTDHIFKNVKISESTEEASNSTYEKIRNPLMDLTFLSFNVNDSVFNNTKVRLAFNLAIDRQFLSDSIFDKFQAVENYGILPSFFEGYNEKGYEYDPIKAKRLLSESGLASLLRSKEINLSIPTSDYSIALSGAIQNMIWQNLGIPISLNSQEGPAHYESISEGQFTIAEVNWVADYNQPENFLHLALSPENQHTTENIGGYDNPIYDKLIIEATRSSDKEKRFTLFKQANDIIHSEAVIVPLYSSISTILLSSNLNQASRITDAQLEITRTYFSEDK